MVLWAGFLGPTAFAQGTPEDPVIEDYVVAHGGSLGSPSSGVDAVLFDEFFGNGDAKALVKLQTRKDSRQLTLRVWRQIRRGEFSFALLVFRIEIRGFDALDEPIYARELGGFTFGDSSSGNWLRTLKDLPEDIRRIEITFIGNYE
jgi:hypothetical protein